MAIDPDSLLIFRARKGTAPEEKKKPAAQGPTPKSNDEKKLGQYKPSKYSEPMVLTPERAGSRRALMNAHEEAKSKITQARQAVQESVRHGQPQSQKQEKGPWTEHIVRQEIHPEKQDVTKDINMLGFRIFGRKLEQQSKPRLTSVYGATTLSYKDVEASGTSINIFTNREYISRRGLGRSKGQLSREAAKGHRCVWHPWREAYVICAYCHRPFCFEDTIEFSKDYYCLEDIDSVSQTYKEKVGTSGNTAGTFAGILLMLSFLVFLYFANAQVFYVWQYVAHESLPFIVMHINYSYAFALLDMLAMLLAFITALMIFLQSRKRFFTGSAVCIFSVALFSYQYTNTGTLYLGVVNALIFLAFFMLIYSNATVAESTGNDDIASSTTVLDQNMLRWPNVGKF